MTVAHYMLTRDNVMYYLPDWLEENVSFGGQELTSANLSRLFAGITPNDRILFFNDWMKHKKAQAIPLCSAMVPTQHLWTVPNSAGCIWIAPAQYLRYTVVRLEGAHRRDAGKKSTARNPSGTNRRYWGWESCRSCRISAMLWKRSWFRWELKPRKLCCKLAPRPRGENSGDWPVRLHPSPAGIGGRDSGCEKVRAFGRSEDRPESILSGTQAIKNGSRQKRFPFAPQHIQFTIFMPPCPFSVSPTFFAHSCVSSHLAKLGNLRYYEDTKKEWVQCTK